MRFTALVFVTSCVAPPTPRPAPEPLPVIPNPPPPLPPPGPPRPRGEWRDWPALPGDWTYRATSEGAEATFGSAREPALTFYCDRRSRSVLLTIRIGATYDPVTIRTSTLTRTLIASPTHEGSTIPFTLAGSKPGWTTTLAVTDPLLDAMAFSRGRFVVDRAGSPLVIPAYAEIGRLIEDCRS